MEQTSENNFYDNRHRPSYVCIYIYYVRVTLLSYIDIIYYKLLRNLSFPLEFNKTTDLVVDIGGGGVTRLIF